MKVSKTRAVVIGSLGVVLAVGAISVWASPARVVGGADTFTPNRTHFVWGALDQETSSKDFKNVHLGATVRKHYGPMIATFTVKVAGKGRVEFRLPEDNFKPSKMPFDPSASPGTDTFSFTAVLQESDWTCSDARLQWRSPSGERLKLRFVDVVLDYKVKNVEPDFGCR